MDVNGLKSRVTIRPCDQGLRRKLELEETARLGHVERVENLRLTGGGVRALSDASFAGLHGDDVHAIELVTDVSPRVASTVLDDADG